QYLRLGHDRCLRCGQRCVGAVFDRPQAPGRRSEHAQSRRFRFIPRRDFEIKENVVPGSAVLMYRYEGEGFQSSPLSFVGGTLYEATLPPPSCGTVAEFYVQVEGDAGTVRKLPSQAPQSVFTARVGEFVTDVMHQYDFTGGLPSGWTTSGLWHLSSSCPV